MKNFTRRIKLVVTSYLERFLFFNDQNDHMRLRFLGLAALSATFLFLTGCKSEKARKYSDVLVKKEKVVESDMDEATKKLRGYFASYEYDSIVSVSRRMENEINSVMREIQNIATPKLKEADNFKE